jgi:hypothetical protein
MKEQIRNILKEYLNEIVTSIPISSQKSSQCKKFYDRLKKEFPQTPEYILKEFTINVLCGDKEVFNDVMNQFFGDPIPFLGKMIYDYLKGPWKLQIIQVNPEDFTENTINAFIEREFGDVDAYLVHNDKERMDIQRKLATSTGKNEPIIVIKHKNGKYEMVEGWHRTMSALKLGDNGEDLKNWDKVKIRAFVLEK